MHEASRLRAQIEAIDAELRTLMQRREELHGMRHGMTLAWLQATYGVEPGSLVRDRGAIYAQIEAIDAELRTLMQRREELHGIRHGLTLAWLQGEKQKKDGSFSIRETMLYGAWELMPTEATEVLSAERE